MKQKNGLVVTQTLTTPENVDNIVYTLKHNQEIITNIKLNGNFDETNEFPLVKIILTILFYSRQLQKLSITDNKISSVNMPYIIKLLENCKNLTYIDLSSNNIGEDDESIKLISESIKYNKTIQTLILNFNKITSNGAFYLADALVKNVTIEHLSLASNIINDNGL